MITGYGHFVQLAESLQWDETAIDLSADVEAWAQLPDDEAARVRGLIAGFCVGETAVATELGVFRTATDDESMAATFASQARDEARHARFFDRVAVEVMEVPGDTRTERLDVLRPEVGADLVALFEERLPAIARQVAEDREGLTEGVVLSAGQHALLDVLDRLSVKMPGVHRGMELVLRDERWHIGFGSRVIQSADVVGEDMEKILTEGEKAAWVWGELISPQAIDKVIQLHRRRLKAVGIKFW